MPKQATQDSIQDAREQLTRMENAIRDSGFWVLVADDDSFRAALLQRFAAGLVVMGIPADQLVFTIAPVFIARRPRPLRLTFVAVTKTFLDAPTLAEWLASISNGSNNYQSISAAIKRGVDLFPLTHGEHAAFLMSLVQEIACGKASVLQPDLN